MILQSRGDSAVKGLKHYENKFSRFHDILCNSVEKKQNKKKTKNYQKTCPDTRGKKMYEIFTVYKMAFTLYTIYRKFKVYNANSQHWIIKYISEMIKVTEH